MNDKLSRSSPWLHLSRSLKLIGVLIFAWIAFHIDWPAFAAHLKATNPLWILLWVVPTLTSAAIRTVRWHLILMAYGHKVPLINLYNYTIEGALLGTVTPGRLGEFGKATFLVTHDVPLKTSVTSVIIDRILDMWTLGLLSSIGLIYLKDIHPVFLTLGLCIGLGMAVASATIAVKKIRTKALRLLTLDDQKIVSINDCLTRMMPRLLFLTLTNSAMIMAMSYTASRAAGIEIEPLTIGFLCTIASIISFIPISVSGIGTRDAFYIFAFGHLCISSSQALFFSLLDGVVLSISGLALQYIFIKSASLVHRQ